MDNQQLYKIYYLKCPINNEVCYIGVSNNPKRRFIEHCSYTYEMNKKNNWIKSLKEIGLKPILEIVEENSSKEEISKREKEHIKMFTKLLNAQSGGYNIKPKTCKPISKDIVIKICEYIVQNKHDAEIYNLIKSIPKSSIAAIRAKRLYASISDDFFMTPYKSQEKRKNFILTTKSKIDFDLLQNICEDFMLFNSPKEVSIKYNLPLRVVQAIYAKQNFSSFTKNYTFPKIYGNRILFKFFIIDLIQKGKDISEIYRNINYKNKGDIYTVAKQKIWTDVWEYFISSTTIEKERINLLLSRVSDKCWVTETGEVNLFYQDIVSSHVKI